MIELKQGKGGHGLQPYDTETGKWAEVPISVNGQSVKDFDSYFDALLDGENKQAFLGMPAEIQDQIKEQFRPQYEEALQREVGILNAKNSVYGKFYSTTAELSQAMPELFGKDFADAFEKAPIYNGNILKQKTGMRNLPVVHYILQKLRYHDIKFNGITEQEYVDRKVNAYQYNHGIYDYEAWVASAVKQGKDICVWRGMHYNRQSDPDKFKNVFTGYVDSEETGDNIPLSLAGGGCWGNVIYMSADKSYSRSYAGSQGMLVHAIFDSNGANVMLGRNQSAMYRTVRSAWQNAKPLVLQNLRQSHPDKADEIVRQIEQYGLNDFGFCCMVCGYDAAAVGGDQLDILNPRRVYVSEQFEQ